MLEPSPTQQAEAGSDLVLDSMIDAVLTIDSAGRIASANAAAERLFGRSRQELAGSDLAGLLLDPDGEQYGAHLRDFAERKAEVPVLGLTREVVGHARLPLRPRRLGAGFASFYYLKHLPGARAAPAHAGPRPGRGGAERGGLAALAPQPQAAACQGTDRAGAARETGQRAGVGAPCLRGDHASGLAGQPGGGAHSEYVARRIVKIEHPSIEQRQAAGKQARKRSKRASHAAWEPPSDRPDPVEVLEQQGTTRVQELLPLRYGRMLESPFTFFRGAAALMAWDLAQTPNAGRQVQLCGDAHLSNFGGFAAPDRQQVFDINDFDETLPGPWEWDLKRLAASVAIAGRNRGFSAKQRRGALLATAGEYRIAMGEFSRMRNLDVWYARLAIEKLLDRWGAEASKKRTQQVKRTVTKARSKDSLRALSKLTTVVDGERRIVSQPPLIVPIEELLPGEAGKDIEAEIRKLLRSYRSTLPGGGRHLMESYRYVHMAHKVVGVGSVGTRAWIILLLGRDDEDPLFLQVKEAADSALAPFAGASAYSNQGRRVVEGQWLMQAAGDPFLGWINATGIDGRSRDFYVRQLWDWKGSADVDRMDEEALGSYGRACGWTLARAHARSGDRVAISAYLGSGDSFDRAIATFAEAYADQNDRRLRRGRCRRRERPAQGHHGRLTVM